MLSYSWNERRQTEKERHVYTCPTLTGRSLPAGDLSSPTAFAFSRRVFCGSQREMCQGRISVRSLTVNDNNVSFFSAFHRAFQGPLSSFPPSYVSLVLLCLIRGRAAVSVCVFVRVCMKVHRALGGHQRLSERIKDPANLGKPGTHARAHTLFSVLPSVF